MMNMLQGGIRTPGTPSQMPSVLPAMGWTPDATASLFQGGFYRPAMLPTGEQPGLGFTGPANDGWIYGNGGQYFTGTQLLNRNVGSQQVTGILNASDHIVNMMDQTLRWGAGSFPYLPQYNVPGAFPAVAGSGLNPYGMGNMGAIGGMGMGMGAGMLGGGFGAGGLTQQPGAPVAGAPYTMPPVQLQPNSQLNQGGVYPAQQR